MMEKYINKKGFTLVELLIVIALVGALSVTMGVSSIKTMNDTKVRNYRQKYSDIFDAARIYQKLKTPPEDCSSYDSSSVCGAPELAVNGESSIDLCCLIESGLLEEDYLTLPDPLSPSDDPFRLDTAVVYRKSGEGEIDIYIVNPYCKSQITSQNIESYSEWGGQCDE